MDWSLGSAVGLLIIVLFATIGWRSKSPREALLLSLAFAAMLYVVLSVIAFAVTGYRSLSGLNFIEWAYLIVVGVLPLAACSMVGYGLKRMFTRAPGENTLRGPN